MARLVELPAAARRTARRRARRLALALGPPLAVRNHLAAHPSPRVNLGCGGALLPGWLNLDRDPPPGAAYADLRHRLPLPDGSVGHLLAEHVIEHLTLEEGRALLADCRRVCAPGGRIRVSTPDLAILCRLPDAPEDAPGRHYLEWATHSFAAGARGSPPALVLNHVVRAWDHRFLYDEPTLALALEDAGFRDVRRHRYGESHDPVFAGAEGRGIDAVGRQMRTFETLALEAARPG